MNARLVGWLTDRLRWCL